MIRVCEKLRKYIKDIRILKKGNVELNKIINELTESKIVIESPKGVHCDPHVIRYNAPDSPLSRLDIPNQVGQMCWVKPNGVAGPNGGLCHLLGLGVEVGHEGDAGPSKVVGPKASEAHSEFGGRMVRVASRRWRWRMGVFDAVCDQERKEKAESSAGTSAKEEPENVVIGDVTKDPYVDFLYAHKYINQDGQEIPPLGTVINSWFEKQKDWTPTPSEVKATWLGVMNEEHPEHTFISDDRL
ncbi:hypothetical protein E3N88_15744 [Mikania micrantha]|uniref:Uncharacterized protein n=1 Tax=Mikania micrantha TaxID=192012 RepID=A0A5N6NWG2_9ASTR|nr:hypothetical protein E3N88_15744 [Mikania micrantha]